MSVEIAEFASRLLQVSGIEKVVSIDDDYSTESAPVELLAVLNTVEADVLVEFVGPLLAVESADRDLIRDKVKDSWKEFSEETKQSLLDRLTPPKEHTPESESLGDDLKFANALPGIFGAKLEMLTLKAWELRQGEIIKDDMPPTLLLVDLSFVDEQRGPEDGLRVIADLLQRHPEGRIYCGLLTSHYSKKTVHRDWKKIADDHGLSQDRFVLIPKDSLRTDQRDFLSLIKLAIMNAHAKSLRGAVSKAYSDCLNEADSELGKLDVYEFERIVCLSSSVEGAWEVDTLLRIFSLFHKKFVRRTLRGDTDVTLAADQLRNLSNIPVGEWGGPTAMEIAIRRLEWFEEAVDVNEQHMPIELGDLFSIDSKPNKLFILVAQPCDLMMRQTGDRHQTVKSGLLLEASPIRDDQTIDQEGAGQVPQDQGLSFKLDFYEPERDWRVNLRKTHYVNLDVLDLCVFKSDGRAQISRADTAPIRMSASWRARFPKLMEKMTKLCKRYGELSKITGLKQADIHKIVGNSTLDDMISVEIATKEGSVSYDICRVGRLKQPRSGALLARYANAFARDAFEHDLTRRPAGKMEKSSDVEVTDATIEESPSLELDQFSAKSDSGSAVGAETSVGEPDDKLNTA